MNHIKHFICGIIIGVANIIPGVSGGTMAVILNVYDKILLAVSRENIKSNVAFLGTLGAGTIAGIICFSKAITYLYENYHMAVNFCFIGLVLGSIPLIYGKAKFEGVQAKNLIPFVFTFLFMIAVTILQMMNATEVKGVESLNLPLMLIWLFIAAFISTIAMILPGISGSFMLLMFGCYTIVMKAISEMDLLILFVTALGVVLGGLTGIKLVKILLRRHPQALYFAILGLMIGSIFSIYPGFSMDSDGACALLGLAVCTAVSYSIGRYSKD